MAAAAAAKAFDVIVLGGGHNGLVAAAYLSRAGKRVVVVERRAILGGAAVTEEIIPGFKFSRASYVYSLFRPQIVKDLDLHRHGLTLLPRVPSSFTPAPGAGAKSLLLGGTAEEDEREIAQFSPADAAKYREYNAWLEKYCAVMRPLLDRAPPDPGALWPPPPPLLSTRLAHSRWWRNLQDALFLGSSLASLGPLLPGFIELLTAPASKLLSKWFSTDSEMLKTTLATDAVVGAMVSPSSPGSAYVLLHHVMCGTWFSVRGGMGALSQAVASAAGEAGAVLRTGVAVRRILVEGTTTCASVAGVELEDGSVLRAPVVLSTAAPSLTLGALLDDQARSALPPALRDSMRVLNTSSGSVKINLALKALPNFRCRPTPGDGSAAAPWHRGTIHFETNMEQLEAAFRDAQGGRCSARPMVEMTLPSVLDDSLAPPGMHVCLLFVQYAPYAPLDLGPQGWDTPGAREAFAERVYSVIEEYCPGFRASIVGQDILTPLDLERIFSLVSGNISHAAMGLDQILWLRPAPGAARYAVPGIAGLYLAGAGSHPGGGVMGAAGKNAAAMALADMQGKGS
jgi:phytoene dehydrogenase-like protein